MSLKFLTFPFFSLLTLIIIIGFMKPDFDVILEKKNVIETQNTAIMNADSILKHIEDMNNDLNNQTQEEQTLFSYLPRTIDQDPIIDAFNFTASQAGLVVTSISFTKETGNNASDIDSSVNTFSTLAVATDATTVNTSDTQKVQPQTFLFEGKVTGSYEAIKSFLNRFSHINRFQNVTTFSLGTKDSGNKEALVGTLEATIKIQYGYLKDKPVVSALNLAFLKEGKPFDFAFVQSMKQDATQLDPLTRTSSGKANPFQ